MKKNFLFLIILYSTFVFFTRPICNSYSLLSANTGSFFAACFDGINPPIRVRITLKTTNMIALFVGSTALIAIFPVKEWMIELIGILRSIVMAIPSTPANKPTINVSALNIEEIFFLDAPMALSTPISFVRSNTEI